MRLGLRKPYFLAAMGENVGFLHVLAVEASEYQKFILVHLGNSQSLSCRELLSLDWDEFPRHAALGAESFY